MSLAVSRVLHAGYLFESHHVRIVFDPLFENPFSVNCQAFPNVKFGLDEIRNLKLDAVFISHYHDDHCSLKSLNFLKRDTPIYLYCVHKELFDLIRQLGFQNIYSLMIGETLEIGDFKITTHLALDEDVDSIFHIQVQDLNILNVVDSWIHPGTLNRLARVQNWDLILWPFQNMQELEVLTPSRLGPASREIPDELQEVLKILNPKYLVPSSCQFQMEEWSWYNQTFFPISYKIFQSQIQRLLPKTQVIRMNPGTTFNLDSNQLQQTKGLSWVLPIGEQDVDYDYDPELIVPPTSEIAKRLPQLTDEQNQRVIEFCKRTSFQLSGIVFWRLRLFDHEGNVSNFDFKSQTQESPDWVTEIPMVKLYGALEKGESLTSLYLRVYTELDEKDVMEDPLIVELYNNKFAAYQKAQLYSC